MRFSVGDTVRVRDGVPDPDYPDLPLGGWRGTVADADAEAGLYLVEWDEETIDAAPEVSFLRAERDGLEVVSAWVAAADLEVAPPGEPLRLAKLTGTRPRPLDMSLTEERVLAILGLTSDDVWPDVDEESLRRAHAHFSRTLAFPFPAGLDLGEAKIGAGLRPVMVLRLLPVEQSLPEVGLLAEVALESSKMEVPLAVLQPAAGDPAEADLAAYTRWIGESLPEAGPAVLPAHPFVKLGVATALLGGVVGGAAATVPGAQLGAIIGACAGGAVGFFVGVRYEAILRAVNRLPPGMLGGALLGTLGGAVAGAALGAMAAAFYGAVPGAILGTLLARWLARRGVDRPGVVVLTAGGAAAGTVGVALWQGRAEALTGLSWGLLAGLLAGAALVASGTVYLREVFRYEE